MVPFSVTSLVLVLAISIKVYSYVSDLCLFSDPKQKILNVVTFLTATGVLMPCVILRKMVYKKVRASIPIITKHQKGNPGLRLNDRIFLGRKTYKITDIK